MLRKLLVAVVALGLPTVLAAQAPGTTAPAATRAKMAIPHGLAMQVQGEVVRADEMPGQNEQEGVDDDDSQNHHGDVDQDDNEPAEMDHDAHEGEHENEQAEQGEHEHEHDGDGSTPAPPATTKRPSQIGRHRP